MKKITKYCFSLVLMLGCIVHASSETDEVSIFGDATIEDFEKRSAHDFKFYVMNLETQENHLIRLRAILKVRRYIGLGVAIMPEQLLDMLRKNTIIWMDNNCDKSGAFAYKDFDSKGERITHIVVRCYDHFVNVITNESIMIHELAHAWHFQFVPNGYDNAKVIQYYKSFKSCFGMGKKYAYMMKNELEFFAEMSKSYFHWRKNRPEILITNTSDDYMILMNAAWQPSPDLSELGEPNFCQQN